MVEKTVKGRETQGKRKGECRKERNKIRRYKKR